MNSTGKAVILSGGALVLFGVALYFRKKNEENGGGGGGGGPRPRTIDEAVQPDGSPLRCAPGWWNADPTSEYYLSCEEAERPLDGGERQYGYSAFTQVNVPIGEGYQPQLVPVGWDMVRDEFSAEPTGSLQTYWDPGELDRREARVSRFIYRPRNAAEFLRLQAKGRQTWKNAWEARSGDNARRLMWNIKRDWLAMNRREKNSYFTWAWESSELPEARAWRKAVKEEQEPFRRACESHFLELEEAKHRRRNIPSDIKLQIRMSCLRTAGTYFPEPYSSYPAESSRLRVRTPLKPWQPRPGPGYTRDTRVFDVLAFIGQWRS